MTRSIRFQLDEHIDNAVAYSLRARDIAVLTVSEAGLRGSGDAEILAACNRDRQVIVTFDNDYLRLHHQGFAHHGIVYFGRTGRSVSHVIASLILVYEVLDADEIAGTIEFL